MTKETLKEQVQAIHDTRFLDPYQTRLRDLVINLYEGLQELQQELKELHNTVEDNEEILSELSAEVKYIKE